MQAARAWGVPRSVFLSWTEDDREWALALLAYEADLCVCGQPRSESMNPSAEFGTYRADRLRCHACAEIARASERFTGPGSDARGLYISLTRTGGGHD